MRARDLAEPYPFVTTDDDAVDAARMLAEQSLPALLVLDSDGQPHAIVPGSQLIPAYIAEDPVLASVVGDQHDGSTPNGSPGSRWPNGRRAACIRRPRSDPMHGRWRSQP
ncbi:hypothetical protein ABZ614_37335 [Streptomyces sp. NPDC013178]|uniref:hypothetical protein n=1 Tax=Streptomyces sp. NPDC013178 TaxID=3155118 RepID=UPI0033E7A20B